MLTLILAFIILLCCNITKLIMFIDTYLCSGEDALSELSELGERQTFSLIFHPRPSDPLAERSETNYLINYRLNFTKQAIFESYKLTTGRIILTGRPIGSSLLIFYAGITSRHFLKVNSPKIIFRFLIVNIYLLLFLFTTKEGGRNDTRGPIDKS